MDLLRFLLMYCGCGGGRMGGGSSETPTHMWLVALSKELTSFVEYHSIIRWEYVNAYWPQWATSQASMPNFDKGLNRITSAS